MSLDIPYDTETYLHRIGRAGRFGGSGVAVSVVDDGHELLQLRQILFDVGGPSFAVPILPEGELPPDVWTDQSKLDTVESLARVEEEINGRGEDVVRSDSEGELCPQNGERSSNGPMPELEAIQLFRSQFLKLHTDVRPVRFDDLIEMFNAKKINLQESDPHPANEMCGADLETVNEALKCLRIFGSGDDGGSNIENQSELRNETHDEKELQYSDSDSENSHYSDGESSYETDSCISDTADERPAQSECQVCSSWFTEWRNQLAAQRQRLQTQLYMQEMLK